jgi:ribonuclease P protein component
MRKQYRIKDSSEIKTVLNARKKKADGFFSLYVRPNRLSHFRFAVSVGKKYGNAVARNKIKRQVRMVVANHVKRRLGMDIFIIIRPSAAQLSYQSIEKKLKQLINAQKNLRGENS